MQTVLVAGVFDHRPGLAEAGYETLPMHPIDPCQRFIMRSSFPITMRACGMLAFSLVAFAMCGCGGGEGNVTGSVTINGKVVKGGNVTFVSTEGKPSVSAQINEGGTYTMTKVPSGNVKICIDTETFNPAKKSKTPKYSPPPGQEGPEGFGTGDAEGMAKRYVMVPVNFSKPETTTLTYDVVGGTQIYDIDIK